MIEMSIESIRVSLVNYQRVVILKEKGAERYLPIWIGPAEADAIAVRLQEVAVARPLTHDLLRSVIDALGAQINCVIVNDLTNDTFYARLLLTSTASLSRSTLVQRRHRPGGARRMCPSSPRRRCWTRRASSWTATEWWTRTPSTRRSWRGCPPSATSSRASTSTISRSANRRLRRPAVTLELDVRGIARCPLVCLPPETVYTGALLSISITVGKLL